MRTDNAEVLGSMVDLERRRPRVRRTMSVVQWLSLVMLAIMGVGPTLWLFKAATSDTQTIIRRPLGLLAEQTMHWSNFAIAWTRIQVGRYLLNTAVLALGQLVATLVVVICAAYVMSVLRPIWAKALQVAVLATLFIPSVISLIPLYLTILDVPLVHRNLMDTYWAIWLPGAANAFLVLIVKQYFDGLPRELFEAARIDGASTLRVLVSIVLPLSRPILGVASLITVINSWKDFLWPMLVIQQAELQPISVALPKLTASAPFEVQLAGMFLAMLIPILLFLIFQKQFLEGAGHGGALKG